MNIGKKKEILTKGMASWWYSLLFNIHLYMIWHLVDRLPSFSKKIIQKNEIKERYLKNLKTPIVNEAPKYSSSRQHKKYAKRLREIFVFSVKKFVKLNQMHFQKLTHSFLRNFCCQKCMVANMKIFPYTSYWILYKNQNSLFNIANGVRTFLWCIVA